MRIGWIESAKGLGIVLVVFGHAWRGIEASALDLPDPLFRAVDNAIYAFHMPLFFFLSGLVFFPAGRERPFGTFLAGRAARLIWPLALWTWIFAGVKLTAGEAQNGALDWADFPLLPLPPIAHFWFLWALFLLHVGIGGLGRLVPAGRGEETLRRLAAGGVLLALPIGGLLPYAGELLNPALVHLPYFLAGIALSGFVQVPVPRPWALGAGLLALILIWAAVPEGAGTLHALAIVIALSACLAGLSRGQGGWLQALGAASLAIYVMHTIFSAGIREGLLATGVGSLSLHLLAGTLAGLILPWFVFRAVKGSSVRRALGL